MTFARNLQFRVDADGHIDRHEGQLPAVVRLPPVSVTVPADADRRETARLLRLLADELETQGNRCHE